MRHIKSAHPFEKIVFKNKKARAQSVSGQKRAMSAKQRVPEGMTNQKIRESIDNDTSDYKLESSNNFYSGAKGDKYANYKN